MSKMTSRPEKRDMEKKGKTGNTESKTIPRCPPLAPPKTTVTITLCPLISHHMPGGHEGLDPGKQHGLMAIHMDFGIGQVYIRVPAVPLPSCDQ